MKRLLSLLLCCVFALSFVGCGKKGNSSTGGKAPAQPGTQTVSEFKLEYEKGNSLFFSANGDKTEVNEKSPCKDFVSKRKYTTDLVKNEAIAYNFYYTQKADVDIVLYIGAAQSGTVVLNKMFSLKLNEIDITGESKIEVQNADKLENYFVAVKLSAEASEGENELQLTPLDGAIALCGLELRTGSSGVNVYKTNPNVEYGKSIEMDVCGEFAGDGEQFGASDDSPEKEFVVAHDYSGEKQNGGWRYTFKFYSAVSQKVKLDFILAGATAGNVTFDTLYTAKLNGTEIDMSKVVVSNPNMVAYVYFDSASIEITAEEGNNEIYVEAKKGATNFSGIRLTSIDKKLSVEPAKYIPVPGAKTFECEEKVKISGNPDTMDNHMVTYKGVGFFGLKSQTLTYKINASKACSVNGVLVASPYSSSSSVNPNTAFPFNVNGTAVTYQETSIAVKKNSYDDYKNLNFTAELKEGENVITIQGTGCGVNLDKFTLTPTDKTVVLDSLIPYEDAGKEIILECEHYYMLGGYGEERSDSGGAEKKATLNGETYSTSGGYNLGWFNKAGRFAIYGAYASKKGTAKLTLRIAPYGVAGDNIAVRDILSIEVNNDKLEIPSTAVINGVKAGSYQNYTDVEVEINVKEGLNVIRLTKNIYNANLDCLKLKGVDEEMRFCENWQDR